MRKPSNCSIRKIAEATGFHVSTVSRALNNHPKISVRTAVAVLNAAERFGYRPHPRGRTLAVVLPPCGMPLFYYSTSLLNALRVQAAERGYLLDLFSSDQMELLNERSVSGIISFDFNNEMAKSLGARSALPMVCINDSARHIEGVYSVFSDEYGAVKHAVTHLAGYGHTRIAMLINGDINTACNLARRKAFEEMIALYSLDSPSTWRPGIFTDGRGMCILHLHGIVAELVKNGITALISTGESESLPTFHAAIACGLKIPDDLSLVTWEQPDVSGYLPPPLTTCAQDFPKLASEALELLEALMEGRPVKSDVLVGYRFFDRGSVALPRRLKFERSAAEVPPEDQTRTEDRTGTNDDGRTCCSTHPFLRGKQKPGNSTDEADQNRYPQHSAV